MKNRKVYIVMGHDVKTKSTYVSEVHTTMKKAEEYKGYIEEVMKDEDRYYFIYDVRVR
jgi:hypothetical protein